MYTEEEFLNGSVNSHGELTKMKVRVPEQERQRLLEVKSRAKVHRLHDFLQQINANKQNYYNETRQVHRIGQVTDKAHS